MGVIKGVIERDFLKFLKIFHLWQEMKNPPFSLENNGFWRRRRDLNPCASHPTYSLSREIKNPLKTYKKQGFIGVYGVIGV